MLLISEKVRLHHPCVCLCVLPQGEAITWGCCVVEQHSLVFTHSSNEHLSNETVSRQCPKSDLTLPTVPAHEHGTSEQASGIDEFL